MIYFFIYIDNLSEHFLFLYSYLACIAQGNFSWATEKPNSNKVNKKQENDVLIFVLRCYPHLHRNTFVVTSKGQHVLPLKVMYVSLGVEICHARSGPHALPGGDFTGSFSEKRKKSSRNLFELQVRTYYLLFHFQVLAKRLTRTHFSRLRILYIKCAHLILI